jgi:hypothetical protein
MAQYYERSQDQGQPRAIEVWVEAAGMVPIVARAAHEYGASVYAWSHRSKQGRAVRAFSPIQRTRTQRLSSDRMPYGFV